MVDEKRHAITIEELLKIYPYIKDISNQKHRAKGLVVLLNEQANRKYYIYKSGYAKAINANDGRNTDFINAWLTDWDYCFSYSREFLISNLHQYIEYCIAYPRRHIWSERYEVTRKLVIEEEDK